MGFLMQSRILGKSNKSIEPIACLILRTLGSNIEFSKAAENAKSIDFFNSILCAFAALREKIFFLHSLRRYCFNIRDLVSIHIVFYRSFISVNR